MITVEDITASEQTATKLRESEERFGADIRRRRFTAMGPPALKIAGTLEQHKA